MTGSRQDSKTEIKKLSVLIPFGEQSHRAAVINSLKKRGIKDILENHNMQKQQTKQKGIMVHYFDKTLQYEQLDEKNLTINDIRLDKDSNINMFRHMLLDNGLQHIRLFKHESGGIEMKQAIKHYLKKKYAVKNGKQISGGKILKQG